MSSDAETLVKRQAQLETSRSNFESWWHDIAQRVLPSHAVITTESEQGTRRSERQFDSRPASALQRFAAVVEDLLTPRTQIWNTLQPPQELEDDQESQQALEELNKQLYQMRYRPKAHFAENKHACYVSLGAFGNYTLMISDDPQNGGARYEFLHPRECYWASNCYGEIDLHHRKYKLEARVALQKAKIFGWDLPQKIKTEAEKNPFTKFEFLRVVMPNDERMPGRLDYRGMEWAVFDIALADKGHMLARGGFRTWPFGIGRYNISPGEVYARSPAMDAWPAILTLNEEKKSVLRAGQKNVEPPMLLAEDGALGQFDMRSAALNYGYVNDQGTVLAQPLQTGADVPLGLELMQLENQAVDDTFLTSIYRVLLEHPQMTATQVLEIARERAVLLAPTMGRMQSEDLGAMIEREIDILAANGKLPPLPQQLVEAIEHYKIEYQSPMARAMRTGDAQAIVNTLEILPAAIALDPNAAYVYDIPEAVREYGEIRGMPAKLTRDKKQVAELAAQAAEADQAREVAAAAPDVSTAVVNMAKAEQLRAGRAAA